MVGIIHLSSMKNYMWMRRKKDVKRKRKKNTNEKEKDENEMKRKEGRKGVMWWEKERIGGWNRSEKFVDNENDCVWIVIEESVLWISIWAWLCWLISEAHDSKF